MRFDHVGEREKQKGYMSASPPWKRVAECLNRNPASARYYAVVRVRGKQFGHALFMDKL